MTCRTPFVTLATVLLALTAWSRPARADTITLTGGSVQLELNLRAARIAVSGDGFVLRTSAEDLLVDLGSVIPVPAGSSINLGAVVYPSLFSGEKNPELNVAFGTIEGTLTTPDLVLTGDRSQIVTAPFTFTGFITGFAPGDYPCTGCPGPDDQPVLNAALVGQGTMRAAFGWSPPGDGVRPPGVYSPAYLPGTDYHVEYDFGPSAVPEPSSVVLLGTGVLALVYTRRHSDRRDRST